MDQNGSTIFTFSPTASQSVAADHHYPQPISNPNDVFLQAGWTVPQQDSDRDSGLYSFSPFPFEPTKTVDGSEEARLRVSRSREDYAKSVTAARADYDNKLKELASPDECAEDSVASRIELAKNTSNNDKTAAAVEVPKSFDEIYSLSVRNRQRNKDKKRQRDITVDGANGGVDDSIASDAERLAADTLAAAGGRSDSYFAKIGEPQPDCGLMGTLAFAQEVGWLRNAEHSAAVGDAYQRELSLQQSSEGTSQPGCDSFGIEQVNLRRSGDGKLQSRGLSVTSSSGGLQHQVTTNRQQSQPQQSSRMSSSVDSLNVQSSAAGEFQPFDYARVMAHQGAAVMGAAAHTRSELKMEGSGRGGGRGTGVPNSGFAATATSFRQRDKAQPFRVRQDVLHPSQFNSGMDDK